MAQERKVPALRSNTHLRGEGTITARSVFDRSCASRFPHCMNRPFVLLAMILVMPWLAHGLKVEKVADDIVDPRALHFTNGSWGTCVNGQSFQQDALTTFKDRQYAIYYDADGQVCVARSGQTAGSWKVMRFGDYRFKGNDTHNVAVIGICPRDGTIHLSFDHHGHPLHYRVSRPGVALQPDKHSWSTNLFGPITSELQPGTKLTKVTYPRFFRTPDGGLQFGYRIGGSGNGDKHMADYDPKTGSWKNLGACFGRGGQYEGQDSRNAYLNGYDYDGKGRLHVTWCWRETGGPMTNHDLGYAWSKDGGKTWLNNAGHVIGQRGVQSVTVESFGVHLVEIPMNRGLMNAMTQAIDSRNRVHLVTFHLPDSAPQQADWEATRKHTLYFHYWRDAKGHWTRTQMPFIGSRPQLWFDKKDNAYLVFAGDRYHPSPNLSIAAATAKSNWNDWKVIHNEPGPFNGQPQIDRYGAEGSLSIYIQEQAKPSSPTASPLRVIKFDAR
jgi:hypothetical protein